jgi:hypothetical protein
LPSQQRRQEKTRHDVTTQGKTTQDETRQHKMRQGKTRQDTTGQPQDNTRKYTRDETRQTKAIGIGIGTRGIRIGIGIKDRICVAVKNWYWSQKILIIFEIRGALHGKKGIL